MKQARKLGRESINAGSHNCLLKQSSARVIQLLGTALDRSVFDSAFGLNPFKIFADLTQLMWIESSLTAKRSVTGRRK